MGEPTGIRLLECLLGQTLVVLGTDFGRTARINDNDLRDNHKKARACWPGVGSRAERRRETPTVTTSRGPRYQAAVDRAMSALLSDLHAKGLLDQTPVVLGTDFDLTPWINDNDGQLVSTRSQRPHRTSIRTPIASRTPMPGSGTMRNASRASVPVGGELAGKMTRPHCSG